MAFNIVAGGETGAVCWDREKAALRLFVVAPT